MLLRRNHGISVVVETAAAAEDIRSFLRFVYLMSIAGSSASTFFVQLEQLQSAAEAKLILSVPAGVIFTSANELVTELKTVITVAAVTVRLN